MDTETDLDKPISISIDEEESASVEVQKSTEQPSSVDKVPSPEEAVAELKQQLETANSERERIAAQKADIERRAAEETKRADAAQAEVRSSEHQIIANALEIVERDLKMAEQACASAMAAGDYESAARAQVEISKVAAKLVHLSNAKTTIEQRLEKPTEGRVTEQPKHSDPVEQWASQLSPRSAKWIREHRDVVTDPAKSRRLSAAHNAAVDIEGLELDSDSYFSYIEQVMGYRQPEMQREDPAPVQRHQPRVIASAPSSSQSTPASGMRGNSITLTPAERETARAIGMTDKEYAINKMALIKEGKMSA